LSVKVHPQEFEDIHAFAKLQGKTLSSLILESLREQMENWEDEQDIRDVLNRNEPSVRWSDLRKEARA